MAGVRAFLPILILVIVPACVMGVADSKRGVYASLAAFLSGKDGGVAKSKGTFRALLYSVGGSNETFDVKFTFRVSGLGNSDPPIGQEIRAATGPPIVVFTGTWNLKHTTIRLEGWYNETKALTSMLVSLSTPVYASRRNAVSSVLHSQTSFFANVRTSTFPASATRGQVKVRKYS
eukprot:TRINITY_DN11086_c0_g1_i1.p1 TRINITY_DN11086_c0_g1~~TRINITY_DN11086_c0_g1_i1.p1  ORF type:complete len:193 (+),score=8.99 TRINITY_DN11086_c0_g1_i1:54-581(+)